MELTEEESKRLKELQDRIGELNDDELEELSLLLIKAGRKISHSEL